MIQRYLLSAVLILFGLWCLPLYAATIYIWTDEKGEQHITDTQPPENASIQRTIEGESSPDPLFVPDDGSKAGTEPALSGQNSGYSQPANAETGPLQPFAPQAKPSGQRRTVSDVLSAPGTDTSLPGTDSQEALLPAEEYYDPQHRQEAVARAAAQAKAKGDMKTHLRIRLSDAQEAMQAALSQEKRARRLGDTRAAVRANNQQEVIRTRITLLEEQQRQQEKAEKAAAEKTRLEAEKQKAEQAAAAEKARLEAAEKKKAPSRPKAKTTPGQKAS